MQKSPMFGKGLVWAWVALCVGFAAGHILARADRLQARVVLDRMRGEMESLKVETLAASAAQRQVAVLRQELAAAQAALSEAQAAPAPEPAAGAGDDPDGKKQAFSDMILKIGQAQLTGQLEGKLGVLKERLNLTPEQEVELKKILDGESAEVARALDRLMTGKGSPGDFGRLARVQRGQLPEGVAVGLTAAQQLEYAVFQEQEKITSVENRVNLELSGLITSGGLTPEQKDQAFAGLSEMVAADDAADFEAMQGAAEVRAFMDGAMERRMETMRGILTEPQLQVYRQQVESGRQVFSRLMPVDPQ